MRKVLLGCRAARLLGYIWWCSRRASHVILSEVSGWNSSMTSVPTHPCSTTGQAAAHVHFALWLASPDIRHPPRISAVHFPRGPWNVQRLFVHTSWPPRLVHPHLTWPTEQSTRHSFLRTTSLRPSRPLTCHILFYPPSNLGLLFPFITVPPSTSCARSLHRTRQHCHLSHKARFGPLQNNLAFAKIDQHPTTALGDRQAAGL